MNYLNPMFSSSAVLNFHIETDKSENPYRRAHNNKFDTEAHMIKINKAWRTGNRETFFMLWDVIYKQELERNE